MGTLLAIAVTAIGVGFTLLLLATAVSVAAFFAAEDELTWSTWSIVAWIAVFGMISGWATAYLGRRVRRELRTET
jgi:membrane associated rhomboid family serine protease